MKIELVKYKNILILLLSVVSVNLFAQETQQSELDDAQIEQDSLNNLEAVVLLGSRGTPRVNTSSPVPVDILNMKKITSDVAQVNINQILNYTVPSFTSTTQTIADGSDHIDPASLRGFGPDQVLVLVNGKRRHTTALVNMNGTIGRGSVGTDLNAIPSMAIDQLEVLRDGAAAQYGSDAIAGVINLGLRKERKGTQVRITSGFNATEFEAVTEASKGNYTKNQDPEYVKRSALDGFNTQVGVNQGLALGKKGFANITATFDWRTATSRSGERTGGINNSTITGLATDDAYLQSVGRTREDYRMIVGQSQLLGGQVFVNSGYTLNEASKTELYLFGGYSYRKGNSGAFYRLPFDTRNIRSVFPNGYIPRLNPTISDVSVSAGIRGNISQWHYDLSNTYGRNEFDMRTYNLVNASTTFRDNYLNGPIAGLDSTKTSFEIGGFVFNQNTINFDLSRRYDVLKGLNVAFGGEFRLENYQQLQGETASWANYNRRNANAPKSTDPVDLQGTVYLKSTLGDGKLGAPIAGSNVYQGIRPDNSFSAWRNSQAVYIDLEQNFTKAFLVAGALRFEHFSDFGSNISWKVASRLQIAKSFALRGAISTGFRAPSLHQSKLFIVSSLVTGGVSKEQATFQNNSQAATSLGIPKLGAETSFGGSVGFTFNQGPIKLTVDAYMTNVYNRIVYTDDFDGKQNDPLTGEIYDILLLSQASSARFFANAIDTRNKGIDAVLTYNLRLNKHHSIRFDVSGTLANTEIIGAPKTSDILKPLSHRYLSPVNKVTLTEAFPRQKANFLINYSYKKFGVFVRESYIGPVTHVEGTYSAQKNNPLNLATGTDNYYYKQILSGLFVTDVSFSYALNKMMKIIIGANNLFDVYPSLIKASKGSFFRLETDPTQANYNTIVASDLSAKDLGITDDGAITSSNQFVYSRRISQIGLNGRFVFARLEFNF